MADAEESPPTADPTVQEMEERWLRFWDEQGVYRFDPASPKPIYSIDTPPPTVSGKMHIGHAYSYNQMDFVARYKRMRGYNLFYPFGFDDNGLPTERLTEREVGVKLADVGRREFVRLCLETTKRFEASMEQSWRRIGTSCDWSIVYRTIDRPVVKVSQESFVELYRKERAYRAERPSIWCPECATAIAQVEMEDRVLPSTFNDVAFDLVGEIPADLKGKHLIERRTVPGPEANSKPREVVTYHQGAEGRIVISTTRPELIPACVAIFVHPDDARTRHLVGRTIRVPVSGNEVPVLTSDKVDKETGTGVVMNCTFGDLTDIEWWQANNLPLRIVIGPKGTLSEGAGKYAGQSVAHARDNVLRDLDREGRLLAQRHIEHTVNVHERCGTPVEFLVTKQWFVRYLDLKEKFLSNGEAVLWHPAYMRVRYENWVKGLKWDWCMSRQRYFGVPFPVWYCASCDAPWVAPPEALPVDPTVDAPPKTAQCASCGHTEFRGESDVMDTWATSSLTPQIAILTAAERLGAPGAGLVDVHTNPSLARLMPMSLRSQAHEIISFWAFNTIVKAHFHHAAIPWRDTMISGFVKLGKGKKMSKSKGNIVEPLEVIRDHSGDALRYWSATGASLGEDIIWNPKDLTRAQRLVTKLRNIEGFIAKAVGPGKPERPPDHAFTDVDRWVLTEYSRLVRSVTDAWDDFDYTRALRDSEHFVWHVLADHYIELVKHRLYGDRPDAAARWTLHTIGLAIIQVFAPVLVFSTEDVYQEHFRAKERAVSIHVSPWPEPVLEDDKAHHAGEVVREIVAAVRNWKSQKKLPLNAPLATLEVVANEEDRRAIERNAADIAGTTKVAGVEFVRESEVHLTATAVEPVHAKLGPKYKQAAGPIAAELRRMSEALKKAELAPEAVSSGGMTVTTPDGASFRLEPDEYAVRLQPTLRGLNVERVDLGDVTLLLRAA